MMEDDKAVCRLETVLSVILPFINFWASLKPRKISHPGMTSNVMGRPQSLANVGNLGN